MNCYANQSREYWRETKAHRTNACAPIVRSIVQGALLLAVGAAAPAQAVLIPSSAAGKGIDWSNPLDGTAEVVIPSTSTIDLVLDADGGEFGGTVREDRGILEFDITSITSGIQSAFLEFEISGPNSVGIINIYAYSGNGLLDLVDFSEISTLVSQPLLSGVGVHSIDVTSAVQGLLGASSGYAGFVIAMSQEDQMMSIWNVGQAGHLDPRLNVTVPAPASVLTLALCGTVAARRRRGLN